MAIPKAVQLVNEITSYLNTQTEVGDFFNMKNLTKKIEGNNHQQTIRNKVTEGFVWKEDLQDWEAIYDKEGYVKIIKKVEKKEINMDEIIEILLRIEKEIKALNKKKKR